MSEVSVHLSNSRDDGLKYTGYKEHETTTKQITQSFRSCLLAMDQHARLHQFLITECFHISQGTLSGNKSTVCDYFRISSISTQLVMTSLFSGCQNPNLKDSDTFIWTISYDQEMVSPCNKLNLTADFSGNFHSNSCQIF